MSLIFVIDISVIQAKILWGCVFRKSASSYATICIVADNAMITQMTTFANIFTECILLTT